MDRDETIQHGDDVIGTGAVSDLDRGTLPREFIDHVQHFQRSSSALAVSAAIENVDLDAEQRQFVGLFALVAGQDVEPDPDGGDGAWRIAEGVAKDG